MESFETSALIVTNSASDLRKVNVPTNVEDTPILENKRTKVPPARLSSVGDADDSDSGESLKEVPIQNLNTSFNITGNHIRNVKNLQNNFKPPERTNSKVLSNADDAYQDFRNSESEKELESKQNSSNKKKVKKKKVKKVKKSPKELPPVAARNRRPLPQLPVLNEEGEVEV